MSGDLRRRGHRQDGSAAGGRVSRLRDAQLAELRDESVAHQQLLLDLAEQDAQAYGAVVAARRMPKATDEERINRSEVMRRTMLAAAEVPLLTAGAALDVLEGKVIGRCMQRHRHQEFIRFLNAVEAAVPAGKIVHAILDNYAVHKHPKVRAWLDRHPRWTFHFTPTSASWLNAVEGFFAKLAKRRLRRGVFGSLIEVQAAIKRFIAESNGDPKPFVWTADPDRIIQAAKRGHQVLDSHH